MMKKFLKIFAISLCSLLLLLVIAVAIVLWFVLTPEKLTPAVRNQAAKYISCQSEIGRVELTFFGTFPKFGLKADRLILINPLEGAPNDTLISVNKLIGIIHIPSLIRNNELVVSDFRLYNGTVNAFTDHSGKTNFDVFSVDAADTDTVQTGMIFKVIDIENVDLNNMNVSYLDRSMKLKAELRSLSANIRGTVKPDSIAGMIDVKPFDVSLEYGQADSSVLKTDIQRFSAKINGSMISGKITGTVDFMPFDVQLSYERANSSVLKTDIQRFSAKINGSTDSEKTAGTVDFMPFDIQLSYETDSLKINTEMVNLATSISGTTDFDNFSGNIRTKPFNISFSLDDEKYLRQDEIQLNVTADANLSRRSVALKETSVSVNDLLLALSGTVINDTLHKNMNVDLKYRLASWSLKSIMALIPPSFSSYAKGIDAGGLLSSEGSIAGIYGGASFPMMDVRLLLEKGTLNYDAFPVPLREINADMSIRTDLKSPQSYVRINRFHARTPKSSVKTAGTLNNLLTDIRAELHTELDLNLSEFAPLIPDSLNIAASGTVSGKVKTGFSMSQIEKMQVEKMKLSGLLTLTDLDASYDSISVKTDRTVVDFALPALNPASAATGFMFADIHVQSLEASKINTFSTSLTNAAIALETSDVRDSTRIPNVRCVFRMDDLRADLDSIRVSAASPAGNISIAPRMDAPQYPAIDLTYRNDRLQADFGQYSVSSGKIGLDAGVVNDPEKKYLVSQWMPRGSIDLEQGRFAGASLSHPIEMPAVKMKFDPETFAIEKGNVVIDKSDFSLSGELDNISSWFRGDSLLIGKFDFVSEMTDILQIMNLTSGIGHTDEEKAMAANNENSSSPYMVPKQMILTLNTNIRQATFGEDVPLSNIRGNVQVHNGLLHLEELSFTTPAADMRVTSLYGTPRRNHLLLLLDLHMFDIEIGELLRMVPEIDSIMPMLRSFGGKGEFHFSFETFLDSMYNFKMSTIRGASSIRGTDLVLMDGQTFSEIARTLRFRKKTENRVDSLSAEFTIFRNEVDVFPFLIVMDRYKAVVGGRHHLDMTFDYNISVVQSPLPFRLAVNVRGTPDRMKYRLGRSRFPDFYRPASRRVVENTQLELRQMIRGALLSARREEE